MLRHNIAKRKKYKNIKLNITNVKIYVKGELK